MRIFISSRATAACFLCATISLAVLGCLSSAWAQQKSAAAQNNTEPTIRLRIVGGLDGLNQYLRHERPFWTRELSAKTSGRVQAEIVPFDRAGIRAQESLRLVQLGVTPFGTALLSVSADQFPELGAPDLAGLNPEMPAARLTLSAYRPYLEKLLRERFGVELLAVYAYPAQVLFCKRAFSGLNDLSGRRIRTASVSQKDLVEALGATAVPTSFSDIVNHIKSGAADCAITGSMSGNAIGLDELTSHLLTLPLNWGLSIFVANTSAWNALPPEVRALLRSEMPKLEAAIWNESDRETQQGFACNTGASSCDPALRGGMTNVRPSALDGQRLREVFASTVLARWVQRCGASCAQAWESTLGPATGIRLPSR